MLDPSVASFTSPPSLIQPTPNLRAPSQLLLHLLQFGAYPRNPQRALHPFDAMTSLWRASSFRSSLSMRVGTLDSGASSRSAALFQDARPRRRWFSYIKSTTTTGTVSFVLSAVHRAYAWNDRRNMLANVCGSNNTTYHSRTAFHILPLFSAGWFPSQAQAQVKFYQPALRRYNVRANRGIRASTRLSDTGGGAHGGLGRALVLTTGTFERSWWWVLAGVVGRIPRAVDSAALGHRRRNGLKALVVVARLLSPATRTGGTSCFARGGLIYAHRGSHGGGILLGLQGGFTTASVDCLTKNATNFKTIRDTTDVRVAMPLSLGYYTHPARGRKSMALVLTGTRPELKTQINWSKVHLEFGELAH
ncbi:hypothetical protein B0H16DRAFT_1695634 [Mycena metata]|uniref:Uncharacterized protein n=1 Tax=Mycena metata TaxID=1033252 RepID=A0AAD7I5D6_9AGAR|nr:hypothetical protein B0H16DRAFT_1695627 [Mycena metata]KAJ7735478.1 hypothetical protein B0H16DRAFT_1695634 [Mycena metata]